MTSTLHGRMRTLERAAQRDAGCGDCRGRDVDGIGAGESWPSWLDEASCCRRCGRGLKVIARDAIDAL
jgi:hypothetical protein